ncbi:MAG: hypothetical protein AAB225_05085 [Acidobacteriota bacterium]
MFRTLSGFKAQYHYLTLLVAADFDEWRVIAAAPGVTVHGQRQFTEAKAKEHALALAKSYIHEQKREELPVLETLEWQPFQPGEFLNWRP